jgi:hypothetical protein
MTIINETAWGSGTWEKWHSLSTYQEKRLKNGKTVEYPLVEGNRDLDNIFHWFWQLTWKERGDDGKYRTQIASVRPAQVEQVKVLIAGNIELETILAYLRGSM